MFHQSPLRPYKSTSTHRTIQMDASATAVELEEVTEDGQGRHLEHESDVQRMLRNGWCTHHVRALVQTYDRKIFSGLSRSELAPERQKDHSRCIRQPSCTAYNVDMSNYRTRHRTADCRCKSLGVPYEELTAMISNGHVPLVSIETREHSGDIELRLHKRRLPNLLSRLASTASAYTAISHVWADGLGNPEENSLPTCQLRNLKASFEDIHVDSNVGQGFLPRRVLIEFC